MALKAARIQEAAPIAKVQKAAGNNPARLGMLDVPLAGGQKHFVCDSALAPRLIKANHGDLLIQEIDIERLFARLRG